MKYKITIEELLPYEAKETVYLATDGKVYTSTYRVPDGEKYTEKLRPTGETLYSKREVYQQETDMSDILDVIKAVNGIK